MIDFDEQVRNMLRQRADDVTPSPDGWDRIIDKLADEPTPVLAVHRARRAGTPRLYMSTAVAAVFLLMLGVGAALVSNDGTRKNDDNIIAGPTKTDTGPIEGTPAPPPAGAEKPVWPLPGQDIGDAQLDPRDTAAAYLSERFGKKQPFRVEPFEPDPAGDPNSGRVPYFSPVDATTPGSVFVRNDGGRWVVTSSGGEGLSVHMASYDGTDVTAEGSAGTRGAVTVKVTSLNAAGTPLRGPVVFGANNVTAGPFPIEKRVIGAASLIVEVRLADAATRTEHLAEFRVESAAPAEAGPSADPAVSENPVFAWFDAIKREDMDAAWAAMAPHSQEAVGRARFDAMRAELLSTWGPWAKNDQVQQRITELRTGLYVAVLSGTIEQNGKTAFRVTALPVAPDAAGKSKVQPFVKNGQSFGPAATGTLSAEDPFTASVPDLSKEAWFVLDGQDLPTVMRGGQARTERPRLGGGRHVVTLAVLESSGAITTRSVSFVLEN